VGRRGLLELCALAGPLMMAAPGCLDANSMRQPIDGYVSLDGRPIASGAIMIYPTEHYDSDIAVSGGAMIKEGYFSIPRTFGLIPGDYSVVIRASDPQTRPRNDRRDHENSGQTAEEIIPARYNSESRLMLKITEKAIKEVTFHLDSD
jgi:hypothetical protein